MGSEDKGEYTVYWNGVLLGKTPIAPGIIHEVTLSEEALTPEAMSLLEPMGLKMHIKTPKRWRCRGRKRFVKLLMSMGISRNQSESVAGVARIAGVLYGELWRNYFFLGEGL